MAEISGADPPDDNVDAYLDMMLRRGINNFADEPVDFYEVGLDMAKQYTELTEDDAILDVGCSSGEFIIHAAKAGGIPSYLIGLDPQVAPFRDFLPRDRDTSRFTFLQGVGEDIPLPDNAVAVTMAHNVVFRAADLCKMLDEMKRVTEPNGLIMISTNARMHARWRHKFERLLALVVGRDLSMPPDRLLDPAHGCYLEDIPGIVAASGGLEIVDTFTQMSTARITPDRLGIYAYSLKLSANRLASKDPAVRNRWRKAVDKEVVPCIQEHLEREPYFPDTVRRGLFVLRNVKSESGP